MGRRGSKASSSSVPYYTYVEGGSVGAGSLAGLRSFVCRRRRRWHRKPPQSRALGIARIPPPSLPGRRRRRRPFRLFLRLVEKEALAGMGGCPLPPFLPRCEAEAMHGRDIPKIDDIGPREAEPPRLSRGGRRRYGSKEATTPTVHHAKYFFFNVPNVKPSSEPRREWLRKGLSRPRHSAAQNINLMCGLSLLALLSLSLFLSRPFSVGPLPDPANL